MSFLRQLRISMSEEHFIWTLRRASTQRPRTSCRVGCIKAPSNGLPLSCGNIFFKKHLVIRYFSDVQNVCFVVKRYHVWSYLGEKTIFYEQYIMTRFSVAPRRFPCSHALRQIRVNINLHNA